MSAGRIEERSAIGVDELAEGEPAVEAEWERFVADSPAAGFYHSLAWRDVTREAFGHEPHYLFARAEDASRAIVGVLPLFFVRGPFGRRLVSMPMRDRGGVAASDPRAAVALLERATALRDELGCRYLELRGLERLPDEELSAAPEGEAWEVDQGWVTHRLDLEPGVEKLWGRLAKKSLRWSIKKARSNGVTVVEDASEEGMRTFHRIFVKTRCEMGIPPFPLELFLSIHRHLVCAGRAQLLLAYAGDEPVHGLISFLAGDHFIPAYAAPQSAYRKLYANELIIWSSIESAAEHGFRTYDFGADSVLQDGLHAFKRKWGAEAHPMAYHFLVRGGGATPDFDSSGPAFRLARAVWRRLPMRLASWLGAVVTRWLS